jgi:hypothetical protein
MTELPAKPFAHLDALAAPGSTTAPARPSRRGRRRGLGQPSRLAGAGPRLAPGSGRLRHRGRTWAGGVGLGQVRVERWDAPLVRLPDRDVVRDYLIARFVPPEVAVAAAEQVITPAIITKRGAP